MVKVKMNHKGMRELLKSEEIQAYLKSEADAIRDICGDGYVSDIYVGKGRANASVTAESFKVLLDNSKNNTLLKAVHE